jgi:hypothetical protein
MYAQQFCYSWNYQQIICMIIFSWVLWSFWHVTFLLSVKSNLNNYRYFKFGKILCKHLSCPNIYNVELMSFSGAGFGKYVHSSESNFPWKKFIKIIFPRNSGEFSSKNNFPWKKMYEKLAVLRYFFEFQNFELHIIKRYITENHNFENNKCLNPYMYDMIYVEKI